MSRLLCFISFLMSSSIVYAQGSVPTQNNQSISAAIIAALIGAGMGLVTLLAKDLIFPLWQESRIRTRGQNDVLRLYIAPLSVAAEKLYLDSMRIRKFACDLTILGFVLGG